MHSLILFSLTIRSEMSSFTPFNFSINKYVFSDLIKTERNQYEYVENRGKGGYSNLRERKPRKSCT